MVGPSSLLSVSPFLSPRLIAGAFVFGADAGTRHLSKHNVYCAAPRREQGRSSRRGAQMDTRWTPSSGRFRNWLISCAFIAVSHRHDWPNLGSNL